MRGKKGPCSEIFQVPSGLAQVVTWAGAGHGQGPAMFLQQVGMLGRTLLCRWEGAVREWQLPGCGETKEGLTYIEHLGITGIPHLTLPDHPLQG